MRLLIRLFIISLTLIGFFSCDTRSEPLIDSSEVSPWCIIGFDALDRTPEQRINMLKELGIKRYGYNRGKGDFSLMTEEFRLAQNNDIEITSIFLWLNATRDSIGNLRESNQELLDNLSKVKPN